MIYGQSIYDSSIYISSIYKDKGTDVLPDPQPNPQSNNPPLETITYKKSQYLQTSFKLMTIDAAESNVDVMPAGFNISNITAVSMILSGADIEGNPMIENFTRAKMPVDFSVINKNKFNFWAVVFESGFTKAVQVEIRINNKGLLIRTMQAKKVAGDFPLVNFGNADFGTAVVLAMADSDEGFGIKNVKVTLTE